MSESAERARTWRADMKRKGMRGWLLWVPAEFIGEVDALAYKHHYRDVSSYIIDVIRKNADRKPEPVKLDPGQEQDQLKKLYGLMAENIEGGRLRPVEAVFPSNPDLPVGWIICETIPSHGAHDKEKGCAKCRDNAHKRAARRRANARA